MFMGRLRLNGVGVELNVAGITVADFVAHTIRRILHHPLKCFVRVSVFLACECLLWPPFHHKLADCLIKISLADSECDVLVAVSVCVAAQCVGRNFFGRGQDGSGLHVI